MPLFHKPRHKNDYHNPESNNHYIEKDHYQQTYQNNIQRPKFECQLAHGSRTHYISGFKSTKELYQAISESFQIPIGEILFCTLNSFRIDMTKLLGNQVAYDDMIYAHVKGIKKEVDLIKESDTLGLTVTDNGLGYVFIKRVKPDGFIANQVTPARKAIVEVGDHIEKIDGIDFVGKKHLEVAMYLRNLSVGSAFRLRLISPHQSEFAQLIDRNSYKKGGPISYSSGKKTIRLKANGGAVEENLDESLTEAVDRINHVIGTHLGIEDEEMARSIFDRCKDCRNPLDVSEAVDEILGSFKFPEPSKREIWGIISDFNSGVLHKNRPGPSRQGTRTPVMVDELI